jgi:hypothetical protein
MFRREQLDRGGEGDEDADELLAMQVGLGAPCMRSPPAPRRCIDIAWVRTHGHRLKGVEWGAASSAWSADPHGLAWAVAVAHNARVLQVHHPWTSAVSPPHHAMAYPHQLRHGSPYTRDLMQT